MRRRNYQPQGPDRSPPPSYSDRREGHDDPIVADLEDLVKAMVTRIVDHPECVSVSSVAGERSVTMEVHCHPRDVGTMLGRQGSHAQAMRTVLTAAGAVKGVRLMVHFLED